MTVDSGFGTVVHLNDGDDAKQASVLRNVRNLLDELGGDSPIELVVHGEGLTAALASGPLADHITSLIGHGVLVVACNNTMKATGISRAQLVSGVGVVPAGIAELVRRQRDGWAYVRP